MGQQSQLFFCCVLASSVVILAQISSAIEPKDVIGKHILLNSTTDNAKANKRVGKAFGIFQVVSFPNDACSTTDSKNGTCYTSAECSSRGGTSSDSCASGYGVCCLFTLNCGQTSSDNSTTLVQTSTTAPPSSNPCVYTICKMSNNICRIRLDFNSFIIAAPQVGTTVEVAPTDPLNTFGASIGDCTTDTFVVSSPGRVGTPVICGDNSGQHIYVDASNDCNMVVFNIGDSTTTSRQWDILIHQYTCGDTSGGPDGCLQYFTGTSGRVSSFNFPTTATAITAEATHLSNQCYNICFRQEKGFCGICYVTAIGASGTAIAAATQASFGLSLGTAFTPAGPAGNPAAIAAIIDSQIGTACTADYLVIPNAQAAPVVPGTVSGGAGRYCGRVLSTANAKAVADATMGVGVSICSQGIPFQLMFKTDADESTAASAADAAMLMDNELDGAPGGIVGFSLNWALQSCT